MNKLSDHEWEAINEIILNIYEQNNSFELRLYFLRALRELVYFDCAEFSLVGTNLTLYDSAELNATSGSSLDIAHKYNLHKKNVGHEPTDYIFHYHKFAVASHRTTNFSNEVFENSKFHTVFMASFGMKQCCTMCLVSQMRTFAEMSIYSSADTPFSERDTYILDQFVGHLTNHMARLENIRGTSLIGTNVLKLLGNIVTTREAEIIEALLSDKSNSEISDELCISINTLKKHISNIYRKLAVNSRNELKQLILSLEKR